MVVSASTASATARSGLSGPIRLCIGCRQRAAAADLLRVVVAPDAIGTAAPDTSGRRGPGARSSSDRLGGPVAVPVVPDPRRRLPGRGAWLHRDTGCVELAQRRRAFGRALRVPGPVDPTPVSQYVAQAAGTEQFGNSQHHSVVSEATPPAEPRRR